MIIRQGIKLPYYIFGAVGDMVKSGTIGKRVGLEQKLEEVWIGVLV